MRTRTLIQVMAPIGFLVATGVAQAAPVSLGISGFSLVAGSGYGQDTGSNAENGGKLLDVRFASGFAGGPWSLTVDQSPSFVLGSVTFSESDAGNGNGNAGVRGDETDDLDFTLELAFTDPLNTTVSLTGAGTAVAGLVSDAAVDYTLGWTPVDVDFGVGGRFRVSLDTLSFSGIGEQHDLRATVTLLAAPRDAVVSAVPEPATWVLVGMALAGAGLARRRRAA